MQSSTAPTKVVDDLVQNVWVPELFLAFQVLREICSSLVLFARPARNIDEVDNFLLELYSIRGSVLRINKIPLSLYLARIARQVLAEASCRAGQRSLPWTLRHGVLAFARPGRPHLFAQALRGDAARLVRSPGLQRGRALSAPQWLQALR